jgi:hypothetical protein
VAKAIPLFCREMTKTPFCCTIVDAVFTFFGDCTDRLRKKMQKSRFYGKKRDRL